MEGDPEWGIGPDGRGENLFGVLVAELRETLKKGDIQVDLSSNYADETRNPLLELYGDSMIRVLTKIPQEDMPLHCFPGKTVGFIVKEVEKDIDRLKARKPSSIGIHAGINDLEKESIGYIEKHFNNAVTLIHSQLPETHVILSGIIHRLDNPALNSKIDNINTCLKGLEEDKVTFVDHNEALDPHKHLNAKGLHLKASGKKIVAENFRLSSMHDSPSQPKWTKKDKASKNGQSILKQSAPHHKNTKSTGEKPSPAAQKQKHIVGSPETNKPHASSRVKPNPASSPQQPPKGHGD